MRDLNDLDVPAILDLISDGVYVCSPERKIVYWSHSAERITGWTADDIVGHACFEGLLCHVDKDGHALCGEEYCPLHRAMVTGNESLHPLVYVACKDGRRLPIQVRVAPIFNDAGEVIGGVETFHDVSKMVFDLQRAQAIQALSLKCELPHDPRLEVAAHYIPHDILGGDYYAVAPLDRDRYGFVLADVMGHGVSAALYTMHVSSLWNRFLPLLSKPAEFATCVNQELSRVVCGDESFATAVAGVIDLEAGQLRLAGAGGPPILRFRADGSHTTLSCPGLPWGLFDEASYAEVTFDVAPGDSLLLFTDGAVEIADAQGRLLGETGLLEILAQLNYPRERLHLPALEESLLRFSNAIRLEDDLTLLELRRPPVT